MCGGFASYYGPCGATDCKSCYPYGGEDDDGYEPVRDLSRAGYLLDEDSDRPEWWKTVSVTIHVCRRPHSDGKVKVGQTYRKVTRRIIDDETGKQRHERMIRVIQ